MHLLIVDDGQYIVEYLKHLLDWRKLGVDLVETKTNSIEAKEILIGNKVDILISDIRMPEVSGLDLLQLIKDERLKTKVVLLSGYSEFEYAQKAIRLGAADYLLKPVDKEDVEKTMQNVILAMENEKNEERIEWDQFDGFGYLLSTICDNNHKIKDYNLFHEYLKELEFCFFCASKLEQKEEMIIRDNVGGMESFIWRMGDRLFGMIQKVNMLSIKEKVNQVAFSDSFSLQKRNTVRHLFYQFFFQESVSSSDISKLRSYVAFTKIKAKEWGSVKKEVVREFSLLSTKQQKLIYLHEVYNDLYFSDIKLRPTVVAHWMFDEIDNPEMGIQQLLNQLSRVEKETKCTNNDIIRTIQMYIEEHLGDEISLSDLGKLVYLHPVYLSKLYKQETGENLSNYILHKRMEKAAKLLIESNLHVVDVSRIVGYKKSQYFIKLFKLQYGITPQQYRRKQIR
ncbi:response regulator [Niallia alba]|uniref:response regulator transcription factor n=1 Tax=Niallia alba TaxID=2729105 RepID=UPI002E1B4E6B|nr:response regulator [Niallia alba]